MPRAVWIFFLTLNKDGTSAMSNPSSETLSPLLFHSQSGQPESLSEQLLGMKGASLVKLASLGAPVPPGFILATDLCARVSASNGDLHGAISDAIGKGLSQLEELSGLKFGDPADPLLISLRYSSPLPVPNQPQTVLYLGLSVTAPDKACARHGQSRVGWDALFRLVRNFGTEVNGLSRFEFDDILSTVLDEEMVESQHELSAEAAEKVARSALEHYRQQAGREFPQDPRSQLEEAVMAFISRWHSARTRAYVWEQGLDDLPGPALVVQQMIVGTGDKASLAGRFSTHVPGSGERRPHGQFLQSAQGVDLTAGLRMTESIARLEKTHPETYSQLQDWAEKLMSHFKDALDIQFTVEEGKLWLLHSRPSSRTARASLKIALELADKGICTEREALRLINPNVVEEFLHPVLDKHHAEGPLTKGLPASPGSAVGQVVFFAEHAVELAAKGIRTILVRHETTPEDIDGLKVADGIVTVHGGLTSHAAVVARGMGKCCVVGAGEITVNYHINDMNIKGRTVSRNDWISIDGNTGEIFLGQLPQVQPKLEGGMARVLEWADKYRRLGVRANADTAEDAERAVEMGAGGIGLCRTEHMFFEIDRIPVFRKMILAQDEKGRSEALVELLPLQREDFAGLLRVMDGRPVTIRLLDPPLHEFLPRGIRSQSRMAKAMGVPVEEVQRRIEHLNENNPMMGHRGCRLAVTYPEIYAMQVRAIMEASVIVKREGKKVCPEIMVPLISSPRELRVLREQIEKVIQDVRQETGEDVPVKIGTMIETPRAAVNSRAIAHWADFYSFGTNDLTQMGFGFSRDDTGVFLPAYLEQNILDIDPFIQLDKHGIGRMVDIAVQDGRKSNPDIKLGICGEHGGEPESVKFCHGLGLDYVSCSPFRIPVARLAAGQAAVDDPGSEND